MSKVTVSNALLMRSEIQKRINHLIHRCMDNSTYFFVKEEGPTDDSEQIAKNNLPDFNSLKQEMDEHTLNLLSIENILNEVNNSMTLKVNDVEMNVNQALFYVKNLRGYTGELYLLSHLKNLSKSREEYKNNLVIVHKSVIDPQDAEAQYNETLKHATGISAKIEKLNAETIIEVPFAKEYMDI